MAQSSVDERQSTSASGKKQNDSSHQNVKPTSPKRSGLLDEKNWPVLVAKARDDHNVLREAGFRVRTDQISVPVGEKLVAVVRVYIVAPEGVKLEYRDGNYWYNGEIII